MANTLQLKNDIKKIKTALASKNLSATFKNKLKVKLQKAESDLKAATSKAAPKGARATLTNLKEQVKKRGYGVYKGAGVDLEKDAKEPALAAGRRVSKGLKGNQYGNKKSSKGNVYYEYRANRIDVKQPSKSAKYPKLAQGGEVDEKLTENEYNKIVKKLDELYGKDVDKSYIHIYDLWDAYSELPEKDHETPLYTEKQMKIALVNTFENHGWYVDMPHGRYIVKEGYKMANGGMFDGEELDKYVEVNGTFYQKGTPQGVIDALEKARNNKTRVKIYSGDPQTGRDYHEEFDTTGTIGRSTGSIKIPLLIPTSRSSGGGAIMTKNILKIKDTKTGVVLYQANNYKQPNIEIVDSNMAGYSHELIIDGDLYSRHKTKRSAELLKSKLMADGGMMAKGGSMQDVEKYVADKYFYGDTDGFSISKDNKGKYYFRIIDLDTENIEAFEAEYGDYDEKVYEIETDINSKYAKGGMMAKGGLVEHGLKTGDLIDFENLTEDGDIEVINKFDNKKYSVNLNNGTRKEIKRKLPPYMINKDGGMMAEGGVTEKEVVDSNAEMVLSKIKEVHHHADELGNIVTKKSDIEAWVVAKIERASTDLSDITHYLDGQHQKMSMGGGVYNHLHKMDKN